MRPWYCLVPVLFILAVGQTNIGVVIISHLLMILSLILFIGGFVNGTPMGMGNAEPGRQIPVNAAGSMHLANDLLRIYFAWINSRAGMA